MTNNSVDKIKIVELGCGPYKTKGAIGVDILELPGVDIVANINQGLPFFEDNSIDLLITNHTLEHIENIDFLIKEIHRTLNKNGVAQIKVPHFSNPYYFSDLTHKCFFGLYTFDYYANPDSQLKRKVPTFYNNYSFYILNRKLIFKSPYKFRHLFKKHIIQKFFNLSPYFMELYEEYFCYIFPCTEIYFELKPVK